MQKALEALYETERLAGSVAYPAAEVAFAITALRAALAKPEQEPHTDDVTRIMREAGMTFHLGLPHTAVIEQMTRVVDLIYAKATIAAAQKFASELAAPTPRKPLTDEEIDHICKSFSLGFTDREIARAIERAHGITGETK